MKDLGSLRYFLDVEVDSSFKGYLFLQSKYIIDIFITLTLLILRPLIFLLRLMFNILLLMVTLCQTLYCIIVNSFVYLTITHSKITYVVYIISQFFVVSTLIH